MALSTILEELILQGKAVMKTYQMGGSAMGTIPVPRDKCVIVTSFIWHGFNDTDWFTEEDPTRSIDTSIHTMRLQTFDKGKECYWTFRDSFLKVRDTVIGTNYPQFAPGQEYTTYFVSQSNIVIDIWNFKAQTMLFNFAVVPPGFNDSDTPRGYTSLLVNQQTNTDGGGAINNVGTSRNTPLSGIPQIRNEFFDQINSGTALRDPSGYTNKTFCFPLVTFNYVQVNQIPDNWLL